MFETVTLKNGVKIVMETIPFVRSVSFGIWVKNGSRNEDVTTNGISHFIEHMLFKGTESRTAKEIADEMDQIGGQLNAYTAKEYTCYYTKVLDTHFDIAVDILADMFFNSKFDNTEIQKERNVINEEINMYEDTPEDLVHDLLQMNAWKNNSLGYSILGTKESISAFDNSCFKNYLKNNYYPQNTVISIAGNFKAEDAVKKMESYFGNFPMLPGVPSKNFKSEYSNCIVTKEKDIEQVHMCIGFPSISIGSDNSYTLSAINAIFGGGMSSRLFQTLREERGLAYSVYSYNAGYTDTGLFSIYAGLNPGQTKEVFNLIISEINRLFSEPINETMLAKTKEQLKSNYIMSLESSSNRMSSIGRSQLMLNRILSPDEILERIDLITLDSIEKLISEIFDLSKLSFSVVGSISGIDFEGLVEDGKKIGR